MARHRSKPDVETCEHEWNKTNIFTMPGGYDNYECQRCGLKGRRYGVSEYVTTRKGRISLRNQFEGK